jgi:copper chaperone CopZ
MVERELIGVNGVLRAYVNPATETAYVDYDPAEVDPWALARAIERAGYRPGQPESEAVGEVAKDGR